MGCTGSKQSDKKNGSTAEPNSGAAGKTLLQKPVESSCLHQHVKMHSAAEPAGLVGPLSQADLVEYVPRQHNTPTFDRSHLRLGISIEGMLAVAEHLQFIEPREEGDHLFDASKGCTASAFTWKYSREYKRPAKLAWLDAVTGKLKKSGTDGDAYPEYGVKNTSGYDLVMGIIRPWLEDNNYTHLSICEVLLLDSRLAHLRHYVTIADMFWSHMQMEKFLLSGTIQYMNMAEDQGQLQSNQTIWLDYFSLRQSQSDFHTSATRELVGSIGRVVASIDKEFQYVKRAFCVFEMGCALQTGAELKCRAEKYRDSPKYPTLYKHSADCFLKDNPVDVAKAECRSEDDQEQVRSFIRALDGGFDGFNTIITQAILDGAPQRGRK